MGTEEEIKEHEPKCTDNYDRRSCYTCTHKKFVSKNGSWIYECKADKVIPEGKLYEFYDSYKRKEASNDILGDLFGDLFWK